MLTKKVYEYYQIDNSYRDIFYGNGSYLCFHLFSLLDICSYLVRAIPTRKILTNYKNYILSPFTLRRPRKLWNIVFQTQGHKLYIKVRTNN